MPPPSVSVIVTTYNRPEFLRESIRSILAQTYKDFELLVVDNYSNYDAEDLVQSFHDSRMRFFRNDNKGFIGANRNFAIQRAAGKWLAFCDDDDVWAFSKLEKQVAAFRDDYCLIGSGYWYFGDVGTYWKRPARFEGDRGLPEVLLQGSAVFSSWFLKNEKVFFPTVREFQDIEDFQVLTRLIIESKKKVFFLGDPLVGIRVHKTKNEYSRRDKTFNSLNVIEACRPHLPPVVYHQARARQNFLFGLVALRLADPMVKDFFRKAIQESSGALKSRAVLGFFLSLIPFNVRRVFLFLYFRIVNRLS